MSKSQQQIIVSETFLVKVGDLKGYEKNPRKGNIKAIAESLEINKQYRPIVVQKSTNKILAGNHTWLAAQSLGWEEIAVVYVDVDDMSAKKIVLADNRTNDLADYDGQILAELLRDLGTAEGTGYSNEDMDAIFNSTTADVERVMWASNNAGEETLSQNDALLSVAVRPTGLSGGDDEEVDFGEDEEEESLEDKPDDLAGVYTLKDNMVFDGASPWDIPNFRSDMMIEELPEPLHTWAGSATRDMDWDGYWLYNWGVDSTSGMKDLSKILLSFYCWDDYLEPWWHNPSSHMSKVLSAKIKYAITPNFTPNGIPRAMSLFQLFRSRWIGRYLQEIGVRIMPDLQLREDDDEILKIAKRTLPKNLTWASVQTQNLVGVTRGNNPVTEEEAQGHRDWTLKCVRSADPKNLLVYANPKHHDDLSDFFGHGKERNVLCMTTRLHYLGQKVKDNKKQTDRM
jgi:hypothetical protein